MSDSFFSPEAKQARLDAWRARQPAFQSSLSPHIHEQKIRANQIVSKYGNQKFSELTGIDDRTVRKCCQMTENVAIPQRFWDACRLLGE